MRRLRIRPLALAAAVSMLLAAGAQAQSQSDKVTRVSAETQAGLRFTVWTERQAVKFGQDIVVRYEVRNSGPRPIYLVRRNVLEVETTDHSTILIMSPYPFPSEHGEFDYTFTRVGRGRRHRGQYVIPAKTYPKRDTWPIDVYFGYVTDFSEFGRRDPKDVGPNWRMLLSHLIRVVGVGHLTVDVE